MSIDEKIFTIYKTKMGKHIKELRLSKGYSQMDLSTLCDLEKTSISRIENGRTNITLKTAILLSKALEVKLSEIYNFEL